ncbi:hypothetical protein I4U23_018746 [Adineta vaga]|nr:hypothetical protein I4U23_018746 [Adineta vaga]
MKSSLTDTSVWYRLYQTPTRSSLRQSSNYYEIDFPVNDLDFRLRTCYDHAQETFASKARLVVQPKTILQMQMNSDQTTDKPFNIVNSNRREHFNEATKGQHIGPDHFANGRHGYSRVIGGAIPVD